MALKRRANSKHFQGTKMIFNIITATAKSKCGYCTFLTLLYDWMYDQPKLRGSGVVDLDVVILFTEMPLNDRNNIKSIKCFTFSVRKYFGKCIKGPQHMDL